MEKRYGAGPKNTQGHLTDREAHNYIENTIHLHHLPYHQFRTHQKKKEALHEIEHDAVLCGEIFVDNTSGATGSTLKYRNGYDFIFNKNN